MAAARILRTYVKICLALSTWLHLIQFCWVVVSKNERLCSSGIRSRVEIRCRCLLQRYTMPKFHRSRYFRANTKPLTHTVGQSSALTLACQVSIRTYFWTPSTIATVFYVSIWRWKNLTVWSMRAPSFIRWCYGYRLSLFCLSNLIPQNLLLVTAFILTAHLTFSLCTPKHSIIFI